MQGWHKKTGSVGLAETQVFVFRPKWLPVRYQDKGLEVIEAVENFKYLGTIVSNEGSLQACPDNNNTTVCRLKIIWRDLLHKKG